MAHGGYKREVRGRGLESRGVAQAERWDSRTQLDYGPPLGEMSAYVRHRSARGCNPVRIQARQELLLACDVRAAQGGAVLEHPILSGCCTTADEAEWQPRWMRGMYPRASWEFVAEGNG